MWDSRAHRPRPFRPRISLWVRGHGPRQGESGAIPPRGHAFVEARAKVIVSGAADSLFVAIRKCQVHFIVGKKIRTYMILADRGTFRGASSACGERHRASGRTSATCDGVPNASKGSGDPRPEEGAGFIRAQSVSRWSREGCRGVARFLWGVPLFCGNNIIPGKGDFFFLPKIIPLAVQLVTAQEIWIHVSRVDL